MPGLLINGKEILVPGLKILNQKDDARLRLSGEDGRKRTTKWVRQIICHTTKGIPGGSDNRPQHIKPGSGPDAGKEFDVARFWDNDPKSSAAQLIIDTDGSVGCIADLGLYGSYHAAQHDVNNQSIGIELYQMSDAGIYEATLNAGVMLINALTEIFGIQRQVHMPYLKGPVRRLQVGGRDCVGVFGHRDVSNNRGFGDPGDFIMNKLIAAGYEKFDFSKGQDLAAWKVRQAKIGTAADGIPGPNTVQALEAAGYKSGLWVFGKDPIFEQPLPVEDPPSVPPPVETPPVVEAPPETSTWEKFVAFIKALFGVKS